MKNGANEFDSEDADTIQALIDFYYSTKGEVTNDIIRLRMRLDAQRGKLGSLQYYAEVFNVSVWRIRGVNSGRKRPHEIRTRNGDSAQESDISRTNSAQPRTGFGDFEENSTIRRTDTKSARTGNADSGEKSKNSRTKNAPLQQQQQLGGEYGPSMADVIAECRKSDFDVLIGKKFHAHYATRYWKLKDGTRLPDWNWRAQLQVWVYRELPNRSADNGETQDTAGTSAAGNGARHKPRSAARGKSNGAELQAKREELYRKRFGK